MSDYTPTTEEVRKAWNMMPHDRYYKGNLDGQLVSSEEFDRWLAEVKAQVWEEGRQSQYQEYPRIAEVDNPYV